MKKQNDIIFLDTETTGLLEPLAINLDKQPYIIELYMMRVRDGEIVDEYESFFSIPIELPAFIQKLTNIKPQMLHGQPTFVEEYKSIADFVLGARSVVAHNLPFDLGMLWVELSRIGKEFNFPWPIEHICTIEKSMYLENKRLKQSKLYEYATGKKGKENHRAKADVRELLVCYEWLKKEGAI